MGLLFCLAKNVQETESTDECADLDELAMEFLRLHNQIHSIDINYFDQLDPYSDTVLETDTVKELKNATEQMIIALSDDVIATKLKALNKERGFTIEEILIEFKNLKIICGKALDSQDKTIVLIGD